MIEPTMLSVLSLNWKHEGLQVEGFLGGVVYLACDKRCVTSISSDEAPLNET